MPERARVWWRWWLELLTALLLAVPVLALLAAGVVWLWQQGWFLWWLLAAGAVTAIAWWALRRTHARPAELGAAEATLTAPDAGWAPHEMAAWETVRGLSSTADGTVLADRRHMLAVAERTVAAVASHYHPQRTDPAWHFTVPELLLLIERVSSRLRSVLLEQVPLSDRIKAGHLLRAWRYRPVVAAGIKHGRTAYELVRVLRVVNPLNALVSELRDLLIDDLFRNLNANVRRRIVRLWIEEIGRAAIELYSGRLRVDAAALASAAATEGLGDVAAPAEPPGPVRILIAGQTNAGKSTLVNGLLGALDAGVDVLPLTERYAGYELRQDGLPSAHLIDSPGIDDAARIAETTERAFGCDLIVWVVAAHRADRALDRSALDALRAQFAAEPRRVMPPLVVVASHVDRLSPPREWSPPYDVATPDTPKARSMRAALEAIADDLAVPLDTIVPARLDGDPPYNLDLVWLALTEVASEAHRAQAVRILRGALGGRPWQQLWRQVAGSGRIIRRLVKD